MLSNNNFEGKKIKIALIIDRLGGGGAERVVIDIATHLPPIYDPVVITTRDMGNLSYIKTLESNNIPLISIGRKTKYDIDGFIRLREVILKLQPDIIHSHKYGSNVITRLLKLTLRHPPILICHEHTWSYNPSNKGRIWINRFLSPLADSIIAVSENDKKMLIQVEGLRQDKITVIYNGIDFTRLSPTINKQEFLSKINLSDESFIAVILAKLQKQKGHDILIKALEYVIDKFPFFHLLVVGEGELEVSLMELTKSLHLEKNIHFLGFRSDIGNILAYSDLVLLPSLFEGHPIALLEAMAAGKAVIATKVGGVPEVIEDGVSGFLVQPNSIDDLKDKIVYVLSNQNMLKIIGHNASTKVRFQFAIENSIREYSKLYQSLLAHKDVK